MPLTKHLYREDEAIAALIFCIIRGRCVESAFWCQELLDSEMVDELIGAMRRAWLYGVGIQSLSWIRLFQEASSGDTIDPDLILQLVQMLCRAKKDRSILTLLATDVSLQPDRVNAGNLSESYTGSERFIGLAIFQRKTTTAWGGVRAIGDEADALLRKLAMSKHGVIASKFRILLENESQYGAWERRAILVAALCMSCLEFKASWSLKLDPLLSEVEKGLKEWRALMGRRARRVFPIPPECLYYFTERGRSVSVYDTTEKDIMGRLEKPGALWGSSYWDAVVVDWQTLISDDSVREEFYNMYFPDDRPDEWSKSDRAKSHGAGPLQRGATASCQRALQGLVGRLSSAVIWGQLPPIKNTDWTTMPAIHMNIWNLVPVKCRVKEI